ncbi:MAG: acetate--CoA ligase family protein [Candidatus Helarchaeota archaeon]
MTDEIIQQIDALFHAQSIAILGVSARGGKLGNLLLQAYLDIGYKGELIPIHPQAKEIMGLRAYPNLEVYGKPIDLAIIALHPTKVFEAVKDCAEGGQAKGIIIFSSGFAEKSEEGRELQAEIVRYAQAKKVRILGPNCMGLFAPALRLSFFPGLLPIPGMIGFISQSGSLAVQIAFAAALKGIYFSKSISIGNQADLDLCDFLQYLGWDPDTRVIACYVEGIKDGNRFLRVAREVSKKKPIIMWKVGSTRGGRQAAQSHTGSIGGDQSLLERVLTQTGIIRVGNMLELLSRCAAFTQPYLPHGNQVAIISGPGGPAVSSTDACEKAGLELAKLSPETQAQIREIIPEYGTSARNPVDLSLAVAFDETLNHRAAEIVGRDPQVDCLLIYVSILQKTFVKGIIKVQQQVQKPIVLISPIDPSISMDVEGADKIKALFHPIRSRNILKSLQSLYQNGITVHLTEQDGANTLAALYKYSKFLGSCITKTWTTV